jgi:hypothetical protein
MCFFEGQIFDLICHLAVRVSFKVLVYINSAFLLRRTLKCPTLAYWKFGVGFESDESEGQSERRFLHPHHYHHIHFNLPLCQSYFHRLSFISQIFYVDFEFLGLLLRD